MTWRVVCAGVSGVCVGGVAAPAVAQVDIVSVERRVSYGMGSSTFGISDSDSITSDAAGVFDENVMNSVTANGATLNAEARQNSIVSPQEISGDGAIAFDGMLVDPPSPYGYSGVVRSEIEVVFVPRASGSLGVSSSLFASDDFSTSVFLSVTDDVSDKLLFFRGVGVDQPDLVRFVDLVVGRQYTFVLNAEFAINASVFFPITIIPLSESNYSFDLSLPEACPADTNGDGFVSPSDYNGWILAYNSGAPACDQNGDGLCTPADFNGWILNFNAGC